GTSNLGADVTTSSTQTYTGAVILEVDTTLTTTDSNITFGSTLRSDAAETPRDLTVNLDGNGGGTSADLIFNGIVGGASRPLDVITITGDLDLNASIGNSPGATSISVSGAADLGDDVETTGTQTYSGAVTISADGITLTTANSQITFSSTVNSEASEANALNIDVGTSEVEFDGIIGGGTNGSLGAIAITGDLDLDAELASATSINVSLVSDLAANVTTSSTQTYQGAVTVSTDVTLTTTNSNVDFDSTVDAGTLGDALTIAAGTGDVTFDNAIGGSTALGNITITTGALTAAAIDLDGTLSITNSSASSITGVIDDGDVSAALTKAGAGTLTLSATNTYIGATTINAGTLKVTTNGALGTTDGITTIASGATLDLANVTYSTTEAITNNGGTLSTSTGTSVYAGVMTLSDDSTIDVDGTQLTISTAIGDGGNEYAITKEGTGTLVLSATSTYTGDTTINAGTIKLTGNLNSATDLTIASGATLDLQATQTFATLDLDGTISRTAGTSALTISGAASIGGSITTSSTQDYEGAVTLTGHSTFTTSSAQVTFDSTINSEGSETNNFTVTASELQLDGVVGGTRTLGVMDINGTLDLNAAITAATSIDVSSTSDLGANVTTSSTQTYNGATTLSAADRNLTASTVNFGDTITGTGSHDLTITGALDLDGALTSVVELTVTSTSNLGASVTTTSTQTYQGAVTVSADVTLTTTDSNVDFDSTVNAGTAGDALTIAAGTGDVTFDNAIGGSTALGNLSVTTGALTAPAIKAQGTITVTNTSASSITGVISDGASSAILTKAGSGTLTLSGTNTYTGATNINVGVLSMTNNAALGTTAGTTTVASGAALHLSNDITVAEAITISGTGISSNGAIRNVSDSNTLSGLITLAADSEIQIDSGSTLAMNVASGNAITGTYNLTIESVGTSSIADPIATSTGNLTKTGAGTLTLSAANTFTGQTNINAGTLKV
ncbi:MAG: hypothetical protein EBW65_09295, partial [Gammaproteobacteria bacterium]|nr:hypothetical protein [Gammaproteobacteria bacterium]